MSKERFLGRPIESLQYMLRCLSCSDSRLVPVTPDGIYGPNTAAAVTAFQRCRGLPTTGRVDLLTWEAVTEAYGAVDFSEAPTIRPGERNAHVRLAQSMLRGIRDTLGGLPDLEVTGQLDGPAVAAVRRFQQLCDLPVTGTLNPETWHHLQRLYSCAAGAGRNL